VIIEPLYYVVKSYIIHRRIWRQNWESCHSISDISID